MPVASVSLSLGAIELLLRWNIIPNESYLQNQVLGDSKQNGPFLFIIGDSFMAPMKGGDLVDYLYAALAPHGVRIRNTAMSGSGPVQYFHKLRREGPRHRPDVVLLSYYVGNDLFDVGCAGNLRERLLAAGSTPGWKRFYVAQYLRERLRARFPGRVIFQSVVPGFLLIAEPVLRPLHTQEVDYDRMRQAGIPEEHIESARAGNVNPWVVSLGAVNPDYFRDALLMRSECAQRAWEDTKLILGEILDEAAELGAPVLPVIFPHTLQVDTAHYALYRAWKINVDQAMLASNRPQQLLREYFRGRSLEPLDLLEAFRADGQTLYWEQDEHLNIRGQQLSARLIAEEVLRRHGEDDGR